MAEVKFVARLPEFYEYKESSHSRHRSQDIGELGTDEIRNKELRPAKCDPAHSRGRQYAAQSRPAAHHRNHVGRNEQGDRRADPANTCAKTTYWKYSGHSERDDALT